MAYNQYIQFHPADDPCSLSKIGNWVMTFLTDQTIEKTQLALTNVIPRQVQNELQIRKFVIENTLQDHIWQINSIECFDSTLNQTLALDLNSPQAELFIQQLLLEFERYDVEATYLH